MTTDNMPAISKNLVVQMEELIACSINRVLNSVKRLLSQPATTLKSVSFKGNGMKNKTKTTVHFAPADDETIEKHRWCNFRENCGAFTVFVINGQGICEIHAGEALYEYFDN